MNGDLGMRGQKIVSINAYDFDIIPYLWKFLDKKRLFIECRFEHIETKFIRNEF